MIDNNKSGGIKNRMQNANEVLYEDKDVTIKRQSIIIKCYYFPFGVSKEIPFRKINRIEIRNFEWKGKMWGMSATEWGYWMPGDLNRWDYTQFVALYTQSSIKPSFTSPNLNQAYKVLSEAYAKYKQKTIPPPENQQNLDDDSSLKSKHKFK